MAKTKKEGMPLRPCMSGISQALRYVAAMCCARIQMRTLDTNLLWT